jgi:hypothetical protein
MQPMLYFVGPLSVGFYDGIRKIKNLKDVLSGGLCDLLCLIS